MTVNLRELPVAPCSRFYFTAVLEKLPQLSLATSAAYCLVRAYQGSVKLALETLPVTVKVPATSIEVTLEHRFVNQALRLFDDHRCIIADKDFGMDAVFQLEVPDTQLQALTHALTEISSGAVLIETLQ